MLTITSPTPATGDLFGYSVAAVGNDRLLVGALFGDVGAADAGAAYLLSVNGDLLTTYTNPTPAGGDWFANAMAVVGTDKVLIAAFNDDTGAISTGVAYLFSTNGALLTIFTNPAPAIGDHFGSSVAAVGIDRVLIGANLDDTGADNAGAAYLFSLDGVLLTTFTNPTPAVTRIFGHSVAAVGNDRVLIAASDTTNGPGAVYLFSTNGTLLTTFTNLTPATDDNFGNAMAVMDSDRVIIAANHNSMGADEAGAVHLFSLLAPSLTIHFTATNTVAVTWPSPSMGWILQENTNAVASVNWSNAPGLIQDNSATKTLIVNPPTGNRFYRLFKP